MRMESVNAPPCVSAESAATGLCVSTARACLSKPVPDPRTPAVRRRGHAVGAGRMLRHIGTQAMSPSKYPPDMEAHSEAVESARIAETELQRCAVHAGELDLAIIDLTVNARHAMGGRRLLQPGWRYRNPGRDRDVAMRSIVNPIQRLMKSLVLLKVFNEVVSSRVAGSDVEQGILVWRSK